MPKFNEEARAYFHAVLDRLIDEVRGIEGEGGPNPLGIYTRSFAARKVLEHGLDLIRSVIGEELLVEALDRSTDTPLEQREQVKRWIWALQPLLVRHAFSPSTRSLSPYEVMDALSALRAGEVRPMFRAEVGRNRRANQWTLSRRKLEALVWKKRLLALGHPEKHANHLITMAFGEQWDTIRKWKSQCDRILGEDHVASILAIVGGPRDPYLHSSRGLLGIRPRRDAMAGLTADGRAYREELRKASELSAAKSVPPADG